MSNDQDIEMRNTMVTGKLPPRPADREPKPCPCGEVPRVIYVGGMNARWVIECQSCHRSVARVERDKAIRRWNTRHGEGGE